jgi:hypothetical protein
MALARLAGRGSSARPEAEEAGADEVELRRRSESRDDTPELGEEARREMIEEEAEPDFTGPGEFEAAGEEGSPSRRERSTTGEMVQAAGRMSMTVRSGSEEAEEVEAGFGLLAGAGGVGRLEGEGESEGAQGRASGEQREGEGEGERMDVDVDLDEIEMANQEPVTREDWLMDALLETGSCCLFCGGRFCLPV